MNTLTNNVFDPGYWAIPTLDDAVLTTIEHTIANKTKPLGSLGQLESLARQLAQIQSFDNQQSNTIKLNKPTMLVFAADHGIAQNGISIAPPEVTGQMVMNFLAGGAAINCFCRTFDMRMQVIDAGMLKPAAIDHAMLLDKRLGAGTQDFSQTAAMNRAQAQQALLNGAQVAQQHIESGCNVLAFGEMGIGNTSSASALLSLICELSPELTTGKGTGINQQQLDKKIHLLQQAISRVLTQHGEDAKQADIALTEVGGFEIGQIVGAILATAAAGKILLIDGFIVTVAALIATKIAPRSRAYMVFAHTSAEQAHELVLTELAATPLLSLGMRLGEGTGAALALPLLHAAASFYNDMATFESAQVKV